MLDKLTIIITTYKRYGYLKRLLSFFSLYQSIPKLIILDSSPDYPKDPKLVKLLSQDNVNWVRYDSNIFFVKKISEGGIHIKTEFAVLCADDDFLIPSALAKCIKFLSENHDFSSAHGLNFNHSSYESGFRRMALYLLNDKDLSSDSNNSGVRVNDYLLGKSGGGTPYYAVHRTLLFNLIWNETAKYISDQGLSELFPCSLSLIYGKMKIIPVFYSSREINNYNGWSNNKKILERVYSENNISLAVKVLSKHLKANSGLTIQEGGVLLHDAFQIYLNRVFDKINDKKPTINNSLYTFFKKFKHILRIRTRFNAYKNDLLYEGCNPLIYPSGLDDYKKVQKAVHEAKLTSEELNIARKKIFY
jgi:glycosyltransferase domain-containing protein